ncbi:hypothetical protein BH09MYX1_BH09MYX1_43130 [soil metagenome]
MAFARRIFAPLGTAATVAAVAIAAATSCSPGGSSPYPGWDGAFPDINVPSADVVAYAVCGTTIDVVYDEALMSAAPELFAKGANDVPLSPPKTFDKSVVSCLHLRVTRDGAGSITGRQMVWLSPSKDFSKLEEHVLYRLSRTASGWTEETDANGDGAPEQIAETTVDGTGAWAGTVTTTYSGPAKTPVRRFTTAPKDTTLAAYREEYWNDTTWDLFIDGGIARDQQKCVSQGDLPTSPPPKPGSKQPGCAIITCSPAQRTQVLDAMKQALRKVENCAPSAITSKPAAELASGALEPVCMTGAGCGYGETISEGEATAEHPRPVKINVDHLNDDQFMPTVWHELVHIGLGDRGAHPEMMQQLAALLGKGLLVDRTYACEAMCFPSKNYEPTQCDCAACVDEVTLPDGKTTRATRCNGRCSGFAECPGPTPDTGAYCPRQKVFCDTVGECRAACSTGADACGKKDPKTGHYNREGGNKSRACDPSCD